jgi:hypothetical protein
LATATGDGEEGSFFAVGRGLLRVEASVVKLLVPQVVAAEEVDLEAVEKELGETVAALADPENDERYAELLGDRQWCEARLRAARRTREWADRIGRAAGSLRDDDGSPAGAAQVGESRLRLDGDDDVRSREAEDHRYDQRVPGGDRRGVGPDPT